MGARHLPPQSSLYAWRLSRGWSQQQAARHLGISQGYFAKLEQGRQTPRPTIAKRLTVKTGVPLDVLLGIA